MHNVYGCQRGTQYTLFMGVREVPVPNVMGVREVSVPNVMGVREVPSTRFYGCKRGTQYPILWVSERYPDKRKLLKVEALTLMCNHPISSTWF